MTTGLWILAWTVVGLAVNALAWHTDGPGILREANDAVDLIAVKTGPSTARVIVALALIFRHFMMVMLWPVFIFTRWVKR